MIIALASCSQTAKKPVKIMKVKKALAADDEIRISPPKKIGVINFSFDSTEIKSHESKELKSVITYLNTAPENTKIIITGHTDRVGPYTYNKELGLERANKIAQTLIQNGIKKEKIEVFSMGENDPLIKTNNWDQKKVNRRASIELIEIKDQRLRAPISTYKK